MIEKNPADRLSEYVMRHYGARLTPVQIRGPWTYIGSRSGEISGVIVQPDGGKPGYRVMLVDFEAPPAHFTEMDPPPLELT